MKKYLQETKEFNKIVKYVLIIIFFALVLLWGALNHIIINEDIFIYNWQYIFSILFFIFILIKLFKTSNLKLPRKTKELAILLFGIPLIIYMFSAIVLEKTIPSLLHIMISKPGKLIVSIDKKTHKTRRNCHNGFKLKNYNNLLNGELCYLDNKMWSTLKPGDRLILSGNKSIFGFTVKYILPYDNKYEEINNSL